MAENCFNFIWDRSLSSILKTDGDKLLKDLLTNKIFSKQILS